MEYQPCHLSESIKHSSSHYQRLIQYKPDLLPTNSMKHYGYTIFVSDNYPVCAGVSMTNCHCPSQILCTECCKQCLFVNQMDELNKC